MVLFWHESREPRSGLFGPIAIGSVVITIDGGVIFWFDGISAISR